MKTWSTPGLARHLVTHPLRGVTVMRAGWRLRRRGWWHSWPPLPLPGIEYWHFRVVTAYGSSDEAPAPEAVVDAARWSLRQRVGR